MYRMPSAKAKGPPPGLRRASSVRVASTCADLFSSVPKVSLARIACADFLRRLANIRLPPPGGSSLSAPPHFLSYANIPACRASSQGSTRPSDVKVVVEGPAYSHLDVGELQDAILQLERETRDQIERSGSQTFAVKFPRRQNSHRSLTNSDSNDKDNEGEVDPKTSTGGKSQPFKIIVKDETGLLQPQNMRTLLKTILQVRVNFANKVVNDEYTLDSRALLRMAERATRPPLQVSSYEDHLHNLPMTLNKLNIELVRICKSCFCYV